MEFKKELLEVIKEKKLEYPNLLVTIIENDDYNSFLDVLFDKKEFDYHFYHLFINNLDKFLSFFYISFPTLKNNNFYIIMSFKSNIPYFLMEQTINIDEMKKYITSNL